VRAERNPETLAACSAGLWYWTPTEEMFIGTDDRQPEGKCWADDRGAPGGVCLNWANNDLRLCQKHQLEIIGRVHGIMDVTQTSN
jgi:hypothetical protein